MDPGVAARMTGCLVRMATYACLNAVSGRDKLGESK